MSRAMLSPRAVLGAAIGLAGSFLALLVGGSTIAMCLGPLGVTAVQCAAHTGHLPQTGALGPQLVAAWCLGLLVVLGFPRDRWSAAAVIVGSLLGAPGYLATRPLVLEGPDFDDRWLSVPLPVEPVSLLSWAAAGALVAVSILRLTSIARRRRLSISGLTRPD